jgi:cell division protein ZapA
MPLVNVMVNSRAYAIACDEGEEEHLKELAGHVDVKMRELTASVGQVGDQKLLLMAAVLITDELFDARGKLDGHAKKVGDLSTAQAELDMRIVAAEMRASDAIKSAEARAARAVEEAENRAADAEARAAQAIGDAQRRIEDAEARVALVLEDAGSNASQALEEAAQHTALEIEEAAQRVERLVEKLKAA